MRILHDIPVKTHGMLLPQGDNIHGLVEGALIQCVIRHRLNINRTYTRN